jgi:hypothetical protein
MALLFVTTIVPAFADHGLVSLPNSNFEIDEDANLRVDHDPPSLDWANVNEERQADKLPGQNDDSFGTGTKEDTPTPVVVSGSIPPNKSDLETFGVYEEENADGQFLHLFWSRVQDPSGTTNMDFEFNQNKCAVGEADSNCSSNGVTPQRLAGDLLVVYELSRGGTVPNLFLFTWLDGSEGLSCEAANSFPCWGDRTNLTSSGNATGSINTSAIPVGESDGLGALDPRTFGEASIDLSVIFDPNKCESFGSAYLKSRSSDSFPAALKDFIAPREVNLTNCGKVIIRKETDPEEDPNATEFGYTKTFPTDPDTANTFTLMDDGVETFDNVLFGDGYTVTEDVIPPGWDVQSIDCDASTGVNPTIGGDNVTFDIDDDSDVVDCTFFNRARANLTVTKITENGSGAFDFTSNTLTPPTFTLTTTAPGEGGSDSRDFAGLLAGSYDVAETVPAGWSLTSATCDNGDDPADITLGAGDDVECTFTNARQTGAILITKTRKHAAAGGTDPHAGVTFTVTGGELPEAGVEVVTDENGEACVDDLVLSGLVGDYTVTETVPAHYVADGATDKTVTVETESTCGDGNEATVGFGNTPLTNVTVSVDSQVDGGTASIIECVGADGNPVTQSTGPNGDGSLTVSDLQPTDPDVTLTCKVTVDP